MNKKELKRIVRQCYELFSIKYNHVCHDTDWSTVYNAAYDLNIIPGVTHVELTPNGYRDMLSAKIYKLDIETEYGSNIKGTITCSQQGPANQIDSYDMIIQVYIPGDQELSEGLSDIVKAAKNSQLIKDIKACNTFEDLKACAKKHVGVTALASAFLLTTFSMIPLNDAQKAIMQDLAYHQELEQLYDEGEDIIHTNKYIESETDQTPLKTFAPVSDEPRWEMIADTATTGKVGIEITVYNATVGQCNSKPSVTASGFKMDLQKPVEPYRIVAMERTMMAKHNLKYGDIIKIEGIGKRSGVYQIQDTMNKRFANKNKIDILVNSDIHYGKWTTKDSDIVIYKLANPEEAAQKIKDTMKKAINQKTIDNKQSSIVESLNFNMPLNQLNEDKDLDFNDFDEGWDEYEIEPTVTEEDPVFTTALKVISLAKQYLCQLSVANPIVELNTVDTAYLMPRYYVIDIKEDGTRMLDGYVCKDNNAKYASRTMKDISNSPEVRKKMQQYFFRLLINKGTCNLDHIQLYTSTWPTAKYFSIGKPLIDFIEHLDGFNVKSIEAVHGAKMKKDGTPLLISNINGNARFFGNKDWNGKSYYMPFDNNLTPDTEISDDIKLSHDFVKNFPEKILSKYTAKYGVIAIPTKCFETPDDFLSIMQKFVDADFNVIDEFHYIWTNNDFDWAYDKTAKIIHKNSPEWDAHVEEVKTYYTEEGRIARELKAKKDKEEHDAKIAKEIADAEKFLSTQLSDDVIEMYKQLEPLNLTVGSYAKFHNRPKDINDTTRYRKLWRPVTEEFLKDNDVDIDEIIDDSTARWKEIVRDNEGNEMSILVSNELTKYLAPEGERSSGIMMTRNEQKDYLYLRFNYKFTLLFNKLANNKYDADPDYLIHDVRVEYNAGYWGGVDYHQYDFSDMWLNMSALYELHYFYKSLAYAIHNAYSLTNDAYGYNGDTVDQLNNANEEVTNLNTFDFSAFNKAFTTIITNMYKKFKKAGKI